MIVGENELCINRLEEIGIVNKPISVIIFYSSCAYFFILVYKYTYIYSTYFFFFCCCISSLRLVHSYLYYKTVSVKVLQNVGEGIMLYVFIVHEYIIHFLCHVFSSSILFFLLYPEMKYLLCDNTNVMPWY